MFFLFFLNIKQIYMDTDFDIPVKHGFGIVGDLQHFLAFLIYKTSSEINDILVQRQTWIMYEGCYRISLQKIQV